MAARRSSAISQGEDVLEAVLNVGEVIILINISGDKEDLFCLAYFNDVAALAVVMSIAGAVVSDGSEQECANQHSRYGAPYDHLIGHSNLFFNFAAKLLPDDDPAKGLSRVLPIVAIGIAGSGSLSGSTGGSEFYNMRQSLKKRGAKVYLYDPYGISY